MCADNQLVNALLELGYHVEGLSSPAVLFKPRVFMDGDSWCALLGEDLQTGVAGFGKSPSTACERFDVAWFTCTDTTCGHYRCPTCQKAKQVEKILGGTDA